MLIVVRLKETCIILDLGLQKWLSSSSTSLREWRNHFYRKMHGAPMGKKCGAHCGVMHLSILVYSFTSCSLHSQLCHLNALKMRRDIV